MAEDDPQQELPGERSRRRARALLLLLLRFVSLLVLAVACLLVSIGYHSLLPRARGVARELIETLASTALQGDLEIGQVVQLDTDRIVARHVVIRDPQGRAVIRAEEVTLWPNYRDLLLRGRVHTHGARIERGEVELYLTEDGENVSLVEAFQPVSPGAPGGRASPIPIVIDGIRLVDIEVRGDIPSYAGLHVEDIQAQGRIVFDESVDFHVYHLDGRMTGPTPGETIIDHAVIGFDTNSQEGLGAYLRVHRGDDRLHARVFINRPDATDDETPQHLGLEVHVDRLAMATLTELGVPGTEQLAGTVRGDLRLIGPFDDLVFSSWLVHDAGPVQISGRFADQQDLLVEIETHDFDIQRLVPAAPSIAVGGRARLDITRDPERPERARFHVDAVPLEVTGIAIPAFEASGLITEDAVVIDRIEAPHLGGTVEGHGRVGFDGSLDVHARIDVGDLGGDPNVARAAPTLHGSAEGTIDIESGPRGTALALTTNLRLRNFRAGPVRAARLTVRGRARGAIAAPIVHFDLDGEGVSISGQQLGAASAQLDGGPHEYAVRWRSRGTDVRQLDVGASVRRSGDAWVIRAQEIGLDVGLGPMRGSIGEVRLEGDLVTIDELEIVGEDQRLTAEGRVHTGGGSSELVADVVGLDLERVGALIGGDLASLRGIVTGRLELEGPLREPEVLVTGRVEDVSFDRIRDADITYELRYLDGILSTNVTGDFGTRGTMGVEGPIAVPSFASLSDPQRLMRDAEFDLHVYGGHLNLAFLVPFLGESVQELGITGRIGGDIRLEGTLQEARVEPSVIILDRIALPGWSELRAKIHFALIDGQLAVQPMWIADGAGELAMVEAQLPISLESPPADLPSLLRSFATTPWRVAVRLAPRLLETWPRPVQDHAPAGVLGALSLTASGGDGQPARGDLRGTMEWVEAPVAGTCASSLRPLVQLQGALHEGVTTVDVSGFAEGRHVGFARAEAATPVDDWFRTGSVSIPEPDLLVQLLEMPLEDVPWTCSRASGIATAEVVIRDLLSAAPEVEARLEVRELRIAGGDESELRGTQPFHVLASAHAGGEAGERAEACAIMATEGMLATRFEDCATAALPQETEVIVRAAIPLRWSRGAPLPELPTDAPMDLAMAMSDAHLEPVFALIPQIGDADVIADGRLAATGPWSALQLSGGVQLREGRVRIISLGQQLVDVRGAVRFSGTQALISAGSPLFARDGDGTVSLHGEIGLDGLFPTHAYLDVQPDQFPVRREGAVLATISGTGETRLSIDIDGLEGTVETRNLTVRLPEQMAGNVQAIDDHPDIVVVGTIAPELEVDAGPAYPVHLVVDATQPFWLRRNDFAIQVVAELDVRYLDPNLYIGGYARLPRGYFEVFGKRFEVARGSLAFGGGEELDPVVDLVAVYEIPGSPGANVTVSASGQMSNLRIDFSSTETNDQGEIIALLVSGRTALGAGDPGATQEATEQAARVVTGVAAGILTLGLRQQFGDIVPLIAIETGAQLGDTRIRAGFNADAIVPDFLNEVVLGAYVEGFVTTRAGNQSGAQGGVGGGVTVELQFPFDLVGSGTYVPPTSWGVDLLWEP